MFRSFEGEVASSPTVVFTPILLVEESAVQLILFLTVDMRSTWTSSTIWVVIGSQVGKLENRIWIGSFKEALRTWIVLAGMHLVKLVI